jgi:hypothetical protein
MIRTVVLGMVLVVLSPARSEANHGCKFSTTDDVAGGGKLDVSPGGSKLVVRLENPPRTRVTLSIDSESGQHSELVWDPAVNEGLQRDALLTSDVLIKYRISAFVEEDHAQAGR